MISFLYLGGKCFSKRQQRRFWVEGPQDVWRSVLHEVGNILHERGSLAGQGLVMPDTKISARCKMKECQKQFEN